MEIFGLPTMFALPAAILLGLAVLIGALRWRTSGGKNGLVAVVRVVVYGGFAFFVLIMGLLGYYYSNGGH